MTTLILLLLILTCATHQMIGAPALQRASRRTPRPAGTAPAPRWRNAALGLLALTLITALLAQQTQAPPAPGASARDEIEWVARHAAAPLPGAAATARLDAPALREAE